MKENEIKIEPESLLVSGDKTFFTLQGEGQSLGKPAVFLRLHMCNLACSWCDTKYTWDRKDPRFYEEPDRWSFERSLMEIQKYGEVKRLVVTGGEPMLHQRPLSKFLDFIPDWQVEIETNGTLPPTEEMAKRCQFNVSPKLANSGNPEAVRYRPNVLKLFNTIPDTTFKFVVMNEADVLEVEKIVKECELDVDKIILMPEGVTPDALAEHGQAVAELCKEKGYRLVPRLQIMLWGAKRRT